MTKERIYLDNAATSWPKPPEVLEAIRYYFEELGACAGRSGYREAADAERMVNDTRRQLGCLFSVHAPEQVIFGHNGTDLLNLALHGLIRPHDHVVTTVFEHNSVLRPLKFLQQKLGIEVTYLVPEENGSVTPEAFDAALRDNTRLAVISHASNVTGAIQPVEAIFEVVKSRGVRMLVDAAQTAGHVELNLAESPIDMVAFSGHKGLLGPLGTAAMILQPDVVDQLESVRQGGTGTKSESDCQPEDLPSKYESGNLNVPGLLGLRAAIEFLREETVTALHRRTMQCAAQLIDGLRQFQGITIYGPEDITQRVGVVSVHVENFDPHELATALDSAFGVQCRAGLHCAPLIHEHLGTISSGGSLRFSLGVFQTEEQITRTLEALGKILK